MRNVLRKTKTLDDKSFASDPGLIRLSHAMLKRVQPQLYPSLLSRIRNSRNAQRRKNISWWKTRIAEHLRNGDSRAAVVIRTSPLLVAAYTDELDCVAMLCFQPSMLTWHELSVGSRLLTVNLYSTLEHGLAADLVPGEDDTGQFGNFSPMIADFLSADFDKIEQRKREIDDSEWSRAVMLGQEYLESRGELVRDGRPLCCGLPASLKT